MLLSSKTIEIAEHNDYLELLNRVCYYDAPNLNDALLPYDENAETIAQTLVEMPVVAKYTVDTSGKPTFKGHEVTIDEDGDIAFGTTPIGVHTVTYIQEDSVELPDRSIKSLPCLFAKMKVWKRNKNAIAAIRRLYSENNLHNSWELSVSKYEYSNGIKKITDYSFIGNALIGVAPAYGKAAEVLSVSTLTNELLVAEALSQDLIEAGEQTIGNEVQKLNEEITTEISDVEEIDFINKESTTDVTAETSDESTDANDTENIEDAPTETSELTIRDIYLRVEGAIWQALNRYPDMVWIFPESHTAWAHICEDPETDYYEFDYAVEDDQVNVSNQRAIKLVASPRNINSAFDEKNSALIEAQKQVNDLQAQVNELAPFKEAAEQAAQEKAEAKRQADISELRTYAEESGMLTSEELEKGEIAEMIEALKTSEVKALISDRIVAKNKKTAETATAAKQPRPRVDISAAEVQVDSVSLLKKFIHS